jgi:hypothetical protein
MSDSTGMQAAEGLLGAGGRVTVCTGSDVGVDDEHPASVTTARAASAAPNVLFMNCPFALVVMSQT